MNDHDDFSLEEKKDYIEKSKINLSKLKYFLDEIEENIMNNKNLFVQLQAAWLINEISKSTDERVKILLKINGFDINVFDE